MSKAKDDKYTDKRYEEHLKQQREKRKDDYKRPTTKASGADRRWKNAEEKRKAAREALIEKARAERPFLVNSKEAAPPGPVVDEPERKKGSYPEITAGPVILTNEEMSKASLKNLLDYNDRLEQLEQDLLQLGDFKSLNISDRSGGEEKAAAAIVTPPPPPPPILFASRCVLKPRRRKGKGGALASAAASGATKTSPEVINAQKLADALGEVKESFDYIIAIIFNKNQEGEKIKDTHDRLMSMTREQEGIHDNEKSYMEIFASLVTYCEIVKKLQNGKEIRKGEYLKKICAEQVERFLERMDDGHKDFDKIKKHNILGAEISKFLIERLSLSPECCRNEHGMRRHVARAPAVEKVVSRRVGEQQLSFAERAKPTAQEGKSP